MLNKFERLSLDSFAHIKAFLDKESLYNLSSSSKALNLQVLSSQKEKTSKKVESIMLSLLHSSSEKLNVKSEKDLYQSFIRARKIVNGAKSLKDLSARFYHSLDLISDHFRGLKESTLIELYRLYNQNTWQSKTVVLAATKKNLYPSNFSLTVFILREKLKVETLKHTSSNQYLENFSSSTDNLEDARFYLNFLQESLFVEFVHSVLLFRYTEASKYDEAIEFAKDIALSLKDFKSIETLFRKLIDCQLYDKAIELLERLPDFVILKNLTKDHSLLFSKCLDNLDEKFEKVIERQDRVIKVLHKMPLQSYDLLLTKMFIFNLGQSNFDQAKKIANHAIFSKDNLNAKLKAHIEDRNLKRLGLHDLVLFVFVLIFYNYLNGSKHKDQLLLKGI